MTIGVEFGAKDVCIGDAQVCPRVVCVVRRFDLEKIAFCCEFFPFYAVKLRFGVKSLLYPHGSTG